MSAVKKPEKVLFASTFDQIEEFLTRAAEMACDPGRPPHQRDVMGYFEQVADEMDVISYTLVSLGHLAWSISEHTMPPVDFSAPLLGCNETMSWLFLHMIEFIRGEFENL